MEDGLKKATQLWALLHCASLVHGVGSDPKYLQVPVSPYPLEHLKPTLQSASDLHAGGWFCPGPKHVLSTVDAR